MCLKLLSTLDEEYINKDLVNEYNKLFMQLINEVKNIKKKNNK